MRPGAGILGEHVGRIYEEGNGRPLYVASDSSNLQKRIGHEGIVARLATVVNDGTQATAGLELSVIVRSSLRCPAETGGNEYGPRNTRTLMPSKLAKKDISSVDLLQPGRFCVLIGSKPGLQLLVILVAAVLLCLPCLFYGLPPGTNATTHVKYQYHFSRQFWNGESYPRWLAEENKGYGSPIFLVQYPLPYFATALLRSVTSFPSESRETRELGLFACLALAAAGLAAWFWLRKFTSPLAATLAAAIYMSLPYIVDNGVYARVALGELCTFVWMPMAFCVCESMYLRRRAVFVLGGVFALLVLSNLLAAVLFAPVLTVYAILCGKRTEPSLYRRVLLVFVAQLLGAGMAGAYLVPALAYRKIFDLHQMEGVLPGYQFGLYFLNLTSSDLGRRVILAVGGAVLLAGVAAWYIWHAVADFRLRLCMALALILGTLVLIPNLGLTIVRLSGFALRPAPASDFAATTLLGTLFTVALGFLAYCRVASSGVELRTTLLLWIAGVSFFFMLPFSAPIWKAIPGSAAIQFPFRLGGILCVAVAGLVSVAFDDGLRDPTRSGGRPSRLVITGAAIAAIAGGFWTSRTDQAFLHPRITKFDVTQDVDPMYRAYVPLPYLTAFARALGTTPDGYHVEPTPGDGTLRARLINGDCDLDLKRQSPRELFVSSDCTGEARVRIGQLYSPLWKVVTGPEGRPNPEGGVSPEGLMELTLTPGKQQLRLFFDIGSPERWGTILSGVSLFAGLIGLVYFRGRIGGTRVAARL